jgi:Gpi18-like mannosyltransferase
MNSAPTSATPQTAPTRDARSRLADARRYGGESGLFAVLWVFALSRALFYLSAFSGVWLLPESGLSAVREVNARYALAMHWRWDAIHYYTLTVDGYVDGGGTAFFPLLPLLIHGVAFVLGGFRPPAQLPIHQAEQAPLVAGVLVVHVLFFLALWLLYRLVLHEFNDQGTAERAILYTAIFPMALFYAVPYTEALFLLMSVAMFYFARRRSWVLAGLAVALASLSRSVGVVLIPVLAFEVYLAWRNGELSRGQWARAAAGLLVAPSGMLLFMGHLWQRVGDPIAFVRIHEDVWGHERVFPLTTLYRGLLYIAQPGLTVEPAVYMRGLLNGLMLVAFIAIVALSVRRWRRSYALYAVLLFAFTLSNPFVDQWVLHGQGRFLMVLFPIYMTLAVWGRNQRVHTAILVICLPLFGILTAMYVNWYPVA